MDLSILSDVIVKLGLGAAGMAGIVYTVVYLTRIHARQTEVREKAFMNYIEENNHQKSDLVEKSTSAIVATGESIKQHTEVSRQILQALINKK